MRATPTCDVLVLGLGPAGSRAAWSAARAGLSVIGLDRRAKPGVPIQCAEFVPAILDGEVDGLDAVTRQRIDAMMTVVEDDAPYVTDDFRGRMLDRGAFDRQLADAARVAGADCRFSSHVKRVRPDGTTVLADGTELRARLLIGADGPRSCVGRAMSRVNTEIIETRQVSVPLLKPHRATDIFLSARIPGGYGWMFPRGDIANVGVGVAPSYRDRLKPLLDSLHERLVDKGRVGRGILSRTGGAIPAGGMLEPVGRLGKCPALLAGDAAGLANPVTGAGINAAVLSGTLAGEAASAWLGGDEHALDDYAEELEFVFGPSIRRALSRRRAVMKSYDGGGLPGREALRGGWVAWPEYWAGAANPNEVEVALEDAR